MCGILGLVSKQKSGITENYSKIIKELFLLSDSRGKEASGFASIQNDNVFVHKTPFSAQNGGIKIIQKLFSILHR